MPAFWNARLLLDVYPLQSGFSCTGATKKGRRCGQTFIDRKAESDKILEALSSKDVVTQGLTDRMKIKLRVLSELTLCPRWHRHGHLSQIDDVYLKWSRTIGNFIVEERARIHVLHDQIAQEEYAISVANEGRTRQPRDNPRALQQPVPAAVTDFNDIPTQRLLDELNRRLNQAEEAARPRELRNPAPLPLRQEPFIPQPEAPENSPVVEDNNPLPRRDRPVRLGILADRAANVDAAQAPQPPTPPRSPIPEERASLHRHTHRSLSQATVNRKPLTEECHICYEPFEDPDDAVWCRRRCGQNLHKECFEEWSRGKERREVKCGFCRAKWIWE